MEGDEERFPDFQSAYKMDERELLGAVRVVSWLEQVSLLNPEWLSSDRAYRSGEFKPNPEAPWEMSIEGQRRSEELRARYSILKKFLLFVIDSMLSWELARDLEALEKVCQTLLPESSWRPFRADILLLRKRGHPTHDDEINRRGRPRQALR